jgi:hypothetical protein
MIITCLCSSSSLVGSVLVIRLSIQLIVLRLRRTSAGLIFPALRVAHTSPKCEIRTLRLRPLRHTQLRRSQLRHINFAEASFATSTSPKPASRRRFAEVSCVTTNFAEARRDEVSSRPDNRAS